LFATKPFRKIEPPLHLLNKQNKQKNSVDFKVKEQKPFENREVEPVLSIHENFVEH